MKTRTTIKALYAWMLAITFMAALGVKAVHLHYTSGDVVAKATASHQAEVKVNCYICNFTMHKADLSHPLVFVPVVTVILLTRHTFSFQTVYRTVESINSHSPPCRV